VAAPAKTKSYFYTWSMGRSFNSINPLSRLLNIGRRALQVWQAGGISAVRRKLASRTTSQSYTAWVQKNDSLSSQDIELIKRRISDFANRPLISVVMPVFNTEPQWLKAAVDSVVDQFYPEWELCVVDDGSTRPATIEALKKLSLLDSRIRLSSLDGGGGISAATNRGVAMAKGEYLTFLDHDDELVPHALYMMVEELSAHPQAELIYSDEDKINSKGERFSPMFKPGWDPVLILSQNYICHLSLYRRERIVSVGGLRSVCDGAQDWDLVLRVSSAVLPEQIRHIPHVLYHWRVIPGSTAGGLGAKQNIFKAQSIAVEQHIERSRLETLQVQTDTALGQIRLVSDPSARLPGVSIIVVVTELTAKLKGWVNSLCHQTAHRPLELIIVLGIGASEKGLDEWIELEPWVRVVRGAAQGIAEGLNTGAKVAVGEVLVFMPPMGEPLSSDWLTKLVGFVTLPFSAAVGPKTYSAQNKSCGSAQYLGGLSVVTPILGGLERGDPGPLNRATTPQGCSALDYQGLAIKKTLFESVGGFDHLAFPNALFGVDLCLRISSDGESKGLVHIWVPQVELSLGDGFDSAEKLGLRSIECAQLVERWGSIAGLDHYLNPNLEPSWGAKELYRDQVLETQPWFKSIGSPKD
jgi:GT2 family glycosyltransferase